VRKCPYSLKQFSIRRRDRLLCAAFFNGRPPGFPAAANTTTPVSLACKGETYMIKVIVNAPASRWLHHRTASARKPKDFLLLAGVSKTNCAMTSYTSGFYTYRKRLPAPTWYSTFAPQRNSRRIEYCKKNGARLVMAPPV
jgi:hypothetical protein